MNFKTAALFLWGILTAVFAVGQRGGSACSTLGQNPSTAFPVCGTTAFVQNTVPLCGGTSVPGKNCDPGLTDLNPYWYKFTAFTSGTLGFRITPNDLGDDYDWQLYDITGKNIAEVYTNAALIVASNWSGEGGLTGASSAGATTDVCDGYGKPTFSSMPTLVAGHSYLLLISHFTISQSGYKLEFGGPRSGNNLGGTASITDPKIPVLESATATCDAMRVTVKLNKKMRCNTLAADGSDFQLVGFPVTITGATAPACSNGFDMESFNLVLSNTLPPGNYKIVSKSGSDGNTIGDDCGMPLAPATEISFTVSPIQPTPMDSLVAVLCAPSELRLVFKNNIRCNSVATNGTDFVISGPTASRINSASTSCDASGFTKTIILRLNTPIQTGGNFSVSLVNGSDLNTIVDECGQSTPAGSSLSFSLKDTVSAAFSYSLALGCVTDTISLSHDGRNGVSSWKWLMDDGKTSSLQSPEAYYNRFGEKRISLIVSNGFCVDTSEQRVLLDNGIEAKFASPVVICPNEPASFVDESTGRISSWQWTFGNGFSSNGQVPAPQPYQLPPNTRELRYNVSLVIGNSIGCFDTSVIAVRAVSSCYIAVPGAFTPNNDGLNDYLYPLNAFKSTDLSFKIFNRYGQLVFNTTNWNEKWDGTIKGKAQPAGTYVWTLSYTESDTGKKVTQKGNSTLVR